ncbi:hypothetical protein F5H01DRAFT_378175 [Linnemannia elongata]|nr:hypothetical protein F5H01DRAFT_378175 [Linnemannia elongata]
MSLKGQHLEPLTPTSPEFLQYQGIFGTHNLFKLYKISYEPLGGHTLDWFNGFPSIFYHGNPELWMSEGSTELRLLQIGLPSTVERIPGQDSIPLASESRHLLRPPRHEGDPQRGGEEDGHHQSHHHFIIFFPASHPLNTNHHHHHHIFDTSPILTIISLKDPHLEPLAPTSAMFIKYRPIFGADRLAKMHKIVYKSDSTHTLDQFNGFPSL